MEGSGKIHRSLTTDGMLLLFDNTLQVRQSQEAYIFRDHLLLCPLRVWKSAFNKYSTAPIANSTDYVNEVSACYNVGRERYFCLAKHERFVCRETEKILIEWSQTQKTVKKFTCNERDFITGMNKDLIRPILIQSRGPRTVVFWGHMRFLPIWTHKRNQSMTSCVKQSTVHNEVM